MVFADVGDDLEATPAYRDGLEIMGPFAPSLGTSDGNLVLKALAAFRARWPRHLPDGIHLRLAKNLPVASGLGGGSADAAATLRLLTAMSSKPVDAAELHRVATGLGADVPMCLGSQPALVRGIGEVITPLDHFPACHVVLINPLKPLATADVFRRLAKRDNDPLPPLPDPLARPAQLGLWLEETRNDLELPATLILPIIGEMLGRIRRTSGCMLARMSGSGATVFGLYGSSTQAHQAAHDLRAQWPGFWVAAAPLLAAGQ